MKLAKKLRKINRQIDPVGLTTFRKFYLLLSPWQRVVLAIKILRRTF